MTVIHEVLGPFHQVAEHDHDWPTILIPVLGPFLSSSAAGEQVVCGPGVVLHPAKGAHAAAIGPDGLDALNIVFDPDLFHGRLPGRIDRDVHTIGPSVSRAAHAVIDGARSAGVMAEDLAAAVFRLLSVALLKQETQRPKWLADAENSFGAWPPVKTTELAARLDLHPAWIAQAYRAATGEGVRERVNRTRVAKAVAMLRFTTKPLAAVAIEGGFCDQSHMNRCVKKLLGRTPLEVRAEAEGSAPISPALYGLRNQADDKKP